MLSLAHLPSEELSQILDYLPSSVYILSLWKSGSPLMQQKLSVAVQRISLRDQKWWPRSRWPKCLPCFNNLRSLTLDLYSAYLMPTTTATIEEILKLSPSLEHLELRSKDTIFAIHSTQRVPEPAGSKPPSAELLSKVVTRFPRLQSIGCSVEGFEKFCAAPLFTALQSNLRKISGVSWRIDSLDDISFAAWPRTLEHYDGTVEFWNMSVKDDRYFSKLPPNLTRINALRSIDKFRIMNLFPKHVSLGSLDICQGWTYSKSPRSMPTHIDTVNLSYITEDDFEEQGLDWFVELMKLFPHVKKIDFGAYEYGHPSVRLSRFPSTLTEICGGVVPVLDGDTPEHIQAKLPNLKSLSLYTCYTYELTSEALRAFPPWLTTLKLFMKQGNPIDSLPPNLTELDISQENKCLIQAPLPESLRKVKLGTGPQSAPFQPSELSILPSSVTDLEVKWYANDAVYPKEAPKLPSKLLILKVDHWHRRWFRLLPRTLTSFTSNNVKGIDANIPDNFDRLPPSLTSLILHEAERHQPDSIVLSGSSFSNLLNLQRIRIGLYKFDRSIIHTLTMQNLRYVGLYVTPLNLSDLGLLPRDLGGILGPQPISMKPGAFKLWPINLATGIEGCEHLYHQRTNLRAHPDPATIERYSSNQ